jgi:hypothetical protein
MAGPALRSRRTRERIRVDHQMIRMPFVTLNVSGGQNSAAELR